MLPFPTLLSVQGHNASIARKMDIISYFPADFKAGVWKGGVKTGRALCIISVSFSFAVFMLSDTILYHKIKFSLAYRAKSVTLHEKRKSPFSLQPVAYVVMDSIFDFGLLEALETHARQSPNLSV